MSDRYDACFSACTDSKDSTSKSLCCGAGEFNNANCEKYTTSFENKDGGYDTVNKVWKRLPTPLLPCNPHPVLTCQAGAYFVINQCLYCVSGRFNPVTGQTNCQNCTAGQYSESKGSTTCQLCQEGKFSIKSGATHAGTCKDCGEGKYSDTPGASSDVFCTNCGAGKYSTAVGADSESVCTDCDAGKYSNTDAAGCTDCDAGKYSIETGANNAGVCKDCDAGKYSPEVGASIHTVCQNCTEGKYSTTIGATAPSACLQCDPGKYSMAVGANIHTVCADCSAGKYSQSAASICTTCDAGKYSTEVGAVSESVCKDCLAGKYSTTSGAGVCTDCLPGKYSSETGAINSDVCIPCVAGKSSLVSGASTSNVCIPCAAGFYSVDGVASCEACEAGIKTTKPQTNPYDVTLQDNQNDCYPIPFISNISPNNQTSAGGIVTTFTGLRFTNSSIKIKTNGNEWAYITYKSATSIEATSPPGVGGNIVVQLIINDIDSSLHSASAQAAFSYLPPNITHVTSPPFNGGTIQITGTDFGFDMSLIDILVYDDNGCAVKCADPKVDTTNLQSLQCQFTGVGSSGVTRDIEIIVLNQKIKSSFTYDFDKGEVTGIPVGNQTVAEDAAFEYNIGLTFGMVPTQDVIIRLHATSTSQGLSCILTPSNITIPANDGNNTQKSVVLATSGNLIDEGTGAIAYTCEVFHSVESTDEQYESSPTRVLVVNVINDDEADVKLWTVDANDQYMYDVKFLSFFNLEGASFQYGVRLDTQPTQIVRVEPNITLADGANILSPPQLVGHPKFITFTPSNWSQYQRLTYSSIPDNIDHDLLDFVIAHNIITTDAIFYEKATRRDLLAAVNAADDDTAEVILLENTVLTLQPEDEEPKGITIERFASQPVHDVIIQVQVPSNKIEIIYDETYSSDNTVLIPKNSWNSINYRLKFRAKSGAPRGEMVIKLIPQSLDPKYNASNDGIARGNLVGKFVNLIVPEVGAEPSTNITSSPPTLSAWQKATFQLYSPNPEVVKIEWKLDGGPYKELPCPGTTISPLCTLNTPILPYGRHRLEARAVSDLDLRDGSPAFVEWTIGHCNDPRRIPSQYAKIENDGALECIDCPHPVGADCATIDTEWDGIYAVKGWWTAGTRSDTYYKCPYKGACKGGFSSVQLVNGTKNTTCRKSKCEVGFTGVVCGICREGYYLSDEFCYACPET